MKKDCLKVDDEAFFLFPGFILNHLMLGECNTREEFSLLNSQYRVRISVSALPKFSGKNDLLSKESKVRKVLLSE